MVAERETPGAEAQPFASILPHGLLLDVAAGIVLLSTPRLWRPTLALGCAWEVIPRNMEVVDEAVCLDMARLHEGLLRSLPVGAALQAIMTLMPRQSVPAWEHRRADTTTPLVAAQQAVIRQGMPHQGGGTTGHLREVRTVVTLRVPLAGADPPLATTLQAVLSLPTRSGAALAARFERHVQGRVEDLRGLRQGVEEALRLAGHQVRALDGRALGETLAHTLRPQAEMTPVIVPDIPLNEQVLTTAATRCAGGWTFGNTDGPVASQVLSLHRAPPQTYPGMLSAPRAPQGAQPLALWQAWAGPLSVVVNIAVVEQGKEKERLKYKRWFARVQGKSLENAALAQELDTLLTQFFLTGGSFFWGRVHLVLWGDEPRVRRGVDDVIRAGRRLDLEFLAEPVLGSTLFLQTLPLGFDPAWPAEHAIRRARRLPGANLAHLLPLYGGFRGTPTASILYLNQRGEPVTFDPFDNLTNPHMLVTGMSGSGKSFTIAHLAQQVLPLGASMVILDRLPSYQDLCAVWHGTYIQMDFNAPTCFNPFFGPLDNEHVAFLTAALAEMASGGIERLNREALNVLADAIAYFAQTWDRTRGEPRLGLFVEDVLREGAFNREDEDARKLGRELARKLSMFYGRGPYAGFFDGPNQLALHPTLTVVELSRLRDAPDLQGSLLFALMHLLTQFFAAPARLHQPKYFISDETWSLLKHQATAEVMEEIGRTYRKLHTSAIFLSQYAEDFNSPAGRVLRKGSPVTLFLQQEAEELAELRTMLQLTPVEHALLERVRRYDGWSSGYLRLPGGAGGLIHLVPDRYTRLLVGQDEATRRRREDASRATGGDLQQAMARLMADEGGPLRDPRPVRTLVLLQGLALLLGCAWWVQLPAAARLDALLTVQRQEAIATPPPAGLVTQLEWLYAHRSARLQGLVGLVVVAGIIGIGEGIARRRADVLGGFLLRWWTLGVILLALSPGLIIGALLLPWPLPRLGVGMGFALLTGLMGYGFTCGRPYIP